MEKVEKYVNEAMNWLNSKMNAQNRLALTQDPVVKVAEIIAKAKVITLKYCNLSVWMNVEVFMQIIVLILLFPNNEDIYFYKRTATGRIFDLISLYVDIHLLLGAFPHWLSHTHTFLFILSLPAPSSHDVMTI